MSFLSELVTRSNPLESATYPLTDNNLLSLFGGRRTNSGVTITPESALGVGAAFRGTQIIAGALAGLPLKVYRRADRAEVRIPALEKSDALITKYELWETAVAHMVLWGNAYLFKVREPGSMRVVRLVPIHPSRVSVDVVDEKALGGFYRRFTVDGRTPFTSFEILHIPCLSLDGIKGIGPITATREMFGVALSAEKAAAKMYEHGLLLAGYLEYPDQNMDQKTANALKRKWRGVLGADYAGDIAILDSGAKFHDLSMPAKDAQFLESRKFQVTEIARLLGLPGWMLNDQEKSTSWGTGMEQQFATWAMLTAKPYMQRIEHRIEAELLPTSGSQYAEFLVEGLLRGDSKTRAAFYASGIVNGWMTPNEVRAKENLPPVPWGDEPYLPNNQAADDQLDDDPPPRDDDEDETDDDEDE